MYSSFWLWKTLSKSIFQLVSIEITTYFFQEPLGLLFEALVNGTIFFSFNKTQRENQNNGKSVADDVLSKNLNHSQPQALKKLFQEDQMMMYILQISIENSILSACSYSETAEELWNTLKGVDGNPTNLSCIFEVKNALNALQTG